MTIRQRLINVYLPVNAKLFMKQFFLYAAGLLLFAGCARGQANDNDFAPLPTLKAGQAVATFGGGCFWSMSEAMSELKGVDKVISGYSGGFKKSPTYEEVSEKNTGHAESVQVYYDPKVISYAALCNAFFFAHDPTELGYQGPDEGPEYRSIAFYRNPEEKTALEEVIRKINASKFYGKAIVTEVVPFKAFYAAEKYHQGYYRLNLDRGYIAQVSVPKVMKFRKAERALLKPEFQ